MVNFCIFSFFYNLFRHFFDGERNESIERGMNVAHEGIVLHRDGATGEALVDIY